MKTVPMIPAHSFHPEALAASLKYNPASKSISSPIDGVLITFGKEAECSSLIVFKRTQNIVERTSPTLYYNTASTTAIQEAWGQLPNLESYSELIDDYDVVEVEEAQMKTAQKYGW